MYIESFEHAQETAQREADRRQESYAVTRDPDETGHRVQRRSLAGDHEVLFTAEPDPLKAPRKFWSLVEVDAAVLVGDQEVIAFRERIIRRQAAALRRDGQNSVKVTRRTVKADHADVPVLVLTCRRKPGP